MVRRLSRFGKFAASNNGASAPPIYLENKMDLTKITSRKLIGVIEKRESLAQSLINGVFDLSENPNDGFADIIKANPNAKAVISYERAFAALQDAKQEAIRRVGPVQFDMTSTLITYLANLRGFHPGRRIQK